MKADASIDQSPDPMLLLSHSLTKVLNGDCKSLQISGPPKLSRK